MRRYPGHVSYFSVAAVETGTLAQRSALLHGHWALLGVEYRVPDQSNDRSKEEQDLKLGWSLNHRLPGTSPGRKGIFGGALIVPVSFQKKSYSVITWSAHSISDTNIVGLPNFAP